MSITVMPLSHGMPSRDPAALRGIDAVVDGVSLHELVAPWIKQVAMNGNHIGDNLKIGPGCGQCSFGSLLAHLNSFWRATRFVSAEKILIVQKQLRTALLGPHRS